MRLITSALGTAIICAIPAQASSQGPGQITKVEQIANRYFFYMTGTRSAKPSCDCCGRWEVLVNGAADQSKVATLLTAFATGRTLNITGTGACAAGSNDTEEVLMILVDA